MSEARLSVAVICLLLLLTAPVGDLAPAEEAHPPAGSPFLLKRSVVSSGGSPGATRAFASNGTLGQSTLLGEGLSGDNQLRAGFWAWPPGALSSLTHLSGQPLRDYLFLNFPNPFISSTTIEYMLASEGIATISVFNVQGQEVKTLVAQSQSAGIHFAVWDGFDRSGRRVSPGIYFYCLETSTHRTVRKMILAK
jgi:hypothetical protein